MASKRLTDISTTTGVTIYDFIHIVNTGDTSQDVSGSSYKATIEQVAEAISSLITFTGNTSGNCITDLFVSNLNSCSPLHIQNNSIDNVLIGENGGVNVGIGTNSPTSKLEIKGSDSSSSNYGLKVQNSGGTDNLVVRNDGKVGIGTNTPISKLTIFEDTTSTATTGFNSMRVVTNHPINGTKTPFELYTQNDGYASMVVGSTVPGLPNGYVRASGGYNASLHVVGTNYYPSIILTSNEGSSYWSNYSAGGGASSGFNLISYNGFSVQTPRTSSSGYLAGIHINSSNNVIFGGSAPYPNTLGEVEKVRILGDKGYNSVFDVSQAYYADSSTISVEDGVGIYSGKTKLTATNSYFTRIYNVGESITLSPIFLPPNYTATTNITLTVTDVVSDSILYTEYNSIFSGYTGPILTGITYNTVGLSRFHVTNKGNVGIGTNTPTAKLEVKSNPSTGNIVYPFSVNKSDGTTKVLYISNQNYYDNPNNLGVYSFIYDNTFKIDLAGSSGQFKLNYGNNKFWMNPYPNALGINLLVESVIGGGGGAEAGIRHLFTGINASGTIYGESLYVGTDSSTGTTTIVGKYIAKNNFTNPNATFYPLVVLDGNSGFGTSTPTERLEVNGKTKTTTLQVTSGSPQIGYVLTATDTNGNMTWQEPQDLTKQGTGLTIHFSGKTIFNLPTSPASGNVSSDTTNAKLGMIQKIYHQSSVEPTFPVTWKLVGEGVYFTDELNIIYAEYVTDTWIEYWIIQQQ